LLDTSVLIGVLVGRQDAVDLVAPWLRRREVGTSQLVFAEAIEFVRTQRRPSTLCRQLRRLLREIHPYPLTYPVLEGYADPRLRMRKPHGPGIIGDIDTLIAATALDHGLTIVTSDGDFLRVPQLGVTLLDRKTLVIVSQRII
jgi:predicted nucleic acid-binding protein